MAKVINFSQNAETYLNLADKYVTQGNLPRAMRALKMAQDGEFFGDALLSMAEAYYNNGMYAMAESAFLQLYPHPEYRADALMGLYKKLPPFSVVSLGKLCYNDSK